MNLQELINRGRFVFSGAPERFRVYELVNGKRNTEDIARHTKRHVNNVRRDLSRLVDVGLIQPKQQADSHLKKDGFPVFQKDPLARSVPSRYFTEPMGSPAAQPVVAAVAGRRARASDRFRTLPVPNDSTVLEIARRGEDQLYEFKGPGTEAKKISREIAAMLHTRQGGIVLYGIDDDGNILGSDMTRQQLDQSVQNSVKHSISPSVVVILERINVLGSDIVAVVAPPWNKKDVYQYDERILVRKGTNVFGANPDEVRKLHRGEYIV